MNFTKATKSEELIWSRYKANSIDPGLILSYGFYVHGKLKEKKIKEVLSVIVTLNPQEMISIILFLL